jgi:hypothetical protein
MDITSPPPTANLTFEFKAQQLLEVEVAVEVMVTRVVTIMMMMQKKSRLLYDVT